MLQVRESRSLDDGLEVAKPLLLLANRTSFEVRLVQSSFRRRKHRSRSLPDLSKLAQLTLQPASRLERGYEFASLPYALHNAFGDAAIPYLDSMLERSEFTWVRTNSARELMLASRSEGFAFVADAISNGRAYRQEMIQFVRDQFPELRQADDAALLKFVQARAATK